jgi:hypothetical protein
LSVGFLCSHTSIIGIGAGILRIKLIG